jgi:hypothetical protein
VPLLASRLSIPFLLHPPELILRSSFSTERKPQQNQTTVKQHKKASRSKETKTSRPSCSHFPDILCFKRQTSFPCLAEPYKSIIRTVLPSVSGSTNAGVKPSRPTTAALVVCSPCRSNTKFTYSAYCLSLIQLRKRQSTSIPLLLSATHHRTDFKNEDGSRRWQRPQSVSTLPQEQWPGLIKTTTLGSDLCSDCGGGGVPTRY